MDSNNTHTVIEVTVPPSSQMPVPHSHDAFEETFLGTHGVITVVIDDNDYSLAPVTRYATSAVRSRLELLSPLRRKREGAAYGLACMCLDWQFAA